MISRPAGSNGVIYTVAMSKDSSGDYHQRLHALDAATGNELYGGPVEITGTYPGTGDDSSGGYVNFDPAQYKERSGLLLAGGQVYLTWASHCDIRPYTGWVRREHLFSGRERGVRHDVEFQRISEQRRLWQRLYSTDDHGKVGGRGLL